MSKRHLSGWTVGVCACAMLAAVPLAAGADKTTTDSGKVVAVFNLHGPLTEAPPSIEFNFDLEPKLTLHSLLERLKKAKKDDQLKAVVLTFDKPELGLGQMQEIRQAISDLRAADKDVYCYLEDASESIYALATAASKVVLAPVGEIRLLGIDVEQAYFKNLLDKIGVEADIEHIGDYKSAGEPFTRTGPSEPAKEQIESLVKDIFNQLMEMIADGRQMKPEEVRALVDRGPFLAKDALAAKLIDEVAYAEVFTESLKNKYGDDVALKHDYGAKKGPEIDFSNIFALFKSLGEMMSKARESEKPAVAVVYVDGMIVPGKKEDGLFGDSGQAASTTLRRVLAKARDDDNVKAVVLRVDSPGGSALASDIIWHATEQLRAEKPLIVSMGNVAGSGGYYVSCAAKTIFADPGTLTGSIGVVGGKLVTKGLWDWIGITFHETKIGENADLYNTSRKFDDRQRALVHRYMEDVYGEFKDRVKKGRGDRLKKDLESIAGGRVYTGRQAKDLGLVDKLGGLQDAIKFAAAEANISDYEIRQMPEPKNFMDLFMEGLTGEKKDEDTDNVQIATGKSWTLKSPAIRELLPLLQAADPQRFRVVLRSLMRIELLGSERALMVIPSELTIR